MHFSRLTLFAAALTLAPLLFCASSSFAALSQNCPHVRLLGPENLDEVQ